jgi:phosphoribosyl 1,2-cyclic phosphodiesterase
MDVTFYGVRGSCPCSCEDNRRYGGNTACVSLEVPGQEPILLDLGTGLRQFGRRQPLDGSFRGTALVTHLHWDHIQGLPFFPPADRAGARFDVYAPRQTEGELGAVFGDLMRPPYFPVRYSDLRGAIEFHEVTDDDMVVGDAKVRVRPVPHCGPTVGYRVESEGAVVAYISDHQAPRELSGVADSVLELADGADLLIHDAQYTPEEFAERAHWGHCTVGYAVDVARQAGAHTLVLFHHDPAHGDDEMDRLLDEACDLSARRGGPEVIAAYEGQQLSL